PCVPPPALAGEQLGDRHRGRLPRHAQHHLGGAELPLCDPTLEVGPRQPERGGPLQRLYVLRRRGGTRVCVHLSSLPPSLKGGAPRLCRSRRRARGPRPSRSSWV